MELLKYVYFSAQKSIIKAGNNKFQDLINVPRKIIPSPFFFFFFFLIQFNVPFKIISLIETSQSIGGAKREYPGKTT